MSFRLDFRDKSLIEKYKIIIEPFLPRNISYHFTKPEVGIELT